MNNDYLQPDFYRFNQDSIRLITRVTEKVEKASTILDLGSGCGLIGLELAQHYLPDLLTLLELQEDFRDILAENVKRKSPPQTCTEIFITSFSKWTHAKTYELIVCNPPYYFPDSGQPSANVRRGLARSFLVDDWGVLLELIFRSLASGGLAMLVVKNEKRIQETINRFNPGLSIRLMEDDDLIFAELRKIQ